LAKTSRFCHVFGCSDRLTRENVAVREGLRTLLAMQECCPLVDFASTLRLWRQGHPNRVRISGLAMRKVVPR
jgi:hypothetical protein